MMRLDLTKLSYILTPHVCAHCGQTLPPIPPHLKHLVDENDKLLCGKCLLLCLVPEGQVS